LTQSTRTIHLPADQSPERLDRYLARALPELSRTKIQHLIRQGQITVDGLPARPSILVEPGMRITADIPSPLPTQIAPQPTSLDVVYDDPDLLVIDKPAGMVVHPAAGHHDGTLVNALLARFPELSAGEEGRPGIVHRLDRDTSGLLVVAKTQPALERLREQFKNRQVKKTYLALVYGHPPAPEGVIEAPVGRDPHRRQRMAVLPGGRAARTVYRLLAEVGEFSLLAASPETGRTHQIRVHLAWLGVPVVGDRVYGRRREQIEAPRQFLHSWRLSFDHPIAGQRIDLESPLPDDLQSVLRPLAVSAGYAAADVERWLRARPA
jgi:23S rRNA pseudouridine1911/1915/1917 synthase